jgi:hypothetical protein
MARDTPFLKHKGSKEIHQRDFVLPFIQQRGKLPILNLGVMEWHIKSKSKTE